MSDTFFIKFQYHFCTPPLFQLCHAARHVHVPTIGGSFAMRTLLALTASYLLLLAFTTSLFLGRLAEPDPVGDGWPSLIDVVLKPGHSDPAKTVARPHMRSVCESECLRLVGGMPVGR